MTSGWIINWKRNEASNGASQVSLAGDGITADIGKTKRFPVKFELQKTLKDVKVTGGFSFWDRRFYTCSCGLSLSKCLSIGMWINLMKELMHSCWQRVCVCVIYIFKAPPYENYVHGFWFEAFPPL